MILYNLFPLIAGTFFAVETPISSVHGSMGFGLGFS